MKFLIYFYFYFDYITLNVMEMNTDQEMLLTVKNTLNRRLFHRTILKYLFTIYNRRKEIKSRKYLHRIVDRIEDQSSSINDGTTLQTIVDICQNKSTFKHLKHQAMILLADNHIQFGQYQNGLYIYQQLISPEEDLKSEIDLYMVYFKIAQISDVIDDYLIAQEHIPQSYRNTVYHVPLIENIICAYLKLNDIMSAECYYKQLISIYNNDEKQKYYTVLYSLCLLINFHNNVIDFNYADNQFNDKYPIIKSIINSDEINVRKHLSFDYSLTHTKAIDFLIKQLYILGVFVKI